MNDARNDGFERGQGPELANDARDLERGLGAPGRFDHTSRTLQRVGTASINAAKSMR